MSEILQGVSSCRACAGRAKMQKVIQTPEWEAHHAKMRAEAARVRIAKHGMPAPRAARTPRPGYTPDELVIAATMKGAKGRCQNPRSPRYADYGGRGIEFRFQTIPEATRWVMANLGARPTGRSIDRIDNNRHYEPGNLRWATTHEQADNKRRYKLSAFGERVVALCRARPDLSAETVRTWARSGLTDEEIVARVKTTSGRPNRGLSYVPARLRHR